MPKKEYDWSGGPAELAPHSLAKHTILQEYIKQYVRILTRQGSIPRLNIALIDGFAGGGEYTLRGRIQPGSPVILIESVRAVCEEINRGRKRPLEINARYLFIEKSPSAHRFLVDVIRRRFGEDYEAQGIQIEHGSFENHIGAIIAKLSAKPRPRPIFVLDQYGYTKVPIHMIKQIMSTLPNAEVFLTLAVDHMSAYETSYAGALDNVLSSMKIDAGIAEPFLLGTREIEELDELPSLERNEIMLAIQQFLHEMFAKHAGALFYTPFFIRSSGSNRSYWFLHLANSMRANDAVKELHWRVHNHSQNCGFQHYGRSGTDMLMLGYDPRRQDKQLGFDFLFDDSARASVERELMEELPRLLRERYPEGVSLKELYTDVGNVTPASMEILGDSLNQLCSVGELLKRGDEGEERASKTKLKASDVVYPSQQPLLFPVRELIGKKTKP